MSAFVKLENEFRFVQKKFEIVIKYTDITLIIQSVDKQNIEQKILEKRFIVLIKI